MPRAKDWNLITQEKSDNFTKLIDEPSSTVCYIGRASIGTATSESLWQIKRISVSGNITSVEWANGDDAFNQIWDNRASLSYS